MASTETILLTLVDREVKEAIRLLSARRTAQP